VSPSWASGLRPGEWRQSLKALGSLVGAPRDCVSVAFHVARVVATRLDRKGQVIIRHEAAADAPEGEGPGWRGVVQALELLLAMGDMRDARSEIVVSNHFLRYALVPWRDDVAGEIERLALVRHTLARLYGAHLEGWEVSVALGRHGAAALAAAIDPELLASLRAATRAAGLVVQRIEPLLVAGFNQACAGVEAPGFWFASVESGRVCLARIQDDVWQSVRCQRIGDDWKAELPVILARELLLEEGSPATLPVYVHAPSADGRGFVAGQWVAEGLRLSGDASGQGAPRQLEGAPAEARS